MKKVYCIAFLLLGALAMNAQDYQHGIGVHIVGLDFYGPQSGDYFLQDKLNPVSGKLSKRLFWDPAVQVSYWHRLSKAFDLNLALGVSALQYPLTSNDEVYMASKYGSNPSRSALPYAYLDARANYHFLPRASFMVSPYVTAGFSPSMRGEDIGLDIPFGLGANLNLGKGIYLNWQSDFRMAVSNNNQNHLHHGLGLVYWWNDTKKKKEPEVKPLPLPVVKDTDNDGIPDSEDACPTLAGRRDMRGCPDRDNDGITDSEDNCPEVAGLKQFNGCPDTDGDGVPDSADECPRLPGYSKYRGCPIPDTDKDGFNDEVDKCPTVPSAINNGCPEIKAEDKKKIDMAAQGITFATGSAAILKPSFANLDKIVEILKSEPTYLVDIEGHTDNVGTPEFNLELSQKRADACRDYLADHGIAAGRIKSTGYGDTRPVADNATEAGRAKNRRTEFRIHN